MHFFLPQDKILNLFNTHVSFKIWILTKNILNGMSLTQKYFTQTCILFYEVEEIAGMLKNIIVNVCLMILR